MNHDELVPAIDDYFRAAIDEPVSNQKRREYLKNSRRAFERQLRAERIVAQPADQDIARRLRAFTLNAEGPVVLRYAWLGDSLRGFVFCAGEMFWKELDYGGKNNALWDQLKRIEDWRPNDKRTTCPPDVTTAKQIYDRLVRPLFELVSFVPQSNDDTQVIIIPSGPLFDVPLHVAWVEELNQPLCACVPLAFCFSGTALISRGRFANRVIRLQPNDDLCILACNLPTMETEASKISWNPEHHYFAGKAELYAKVCADLKSPVKLCGQGNGQSLQQIQDIGPEFFIFHGHGILDREERNAGPLLCLENQEYASQFDLASSRWLDDNKLSILAACVTGKAVQGAGGEVSGLLRALAAAGCSALTFSLWEVLNSPTRSTVVGIFQQLKKHSNRCDLSRALQKVYSSLTEAYSLKNEGPYREQSKIECCPFVLYL